MEKRLTYTVNIERDEDGLYVVSVPALPGCFTQGRSFDEALQMAQDAILGFVKVLIKRGEDVPIEDSPISPFAVSVMAPTVFA